MQGPLTLSQGPHSRLPCESPSQPDPVMLFSLYGPGHRPQLPVAMATVPSPGHEHRPPH